jgi:hypothetical protein
MATGPTSLRGKHKVSGNAVKHGLRARKWLSPEEEKDFSTLTRNLVAEYEPTTATEWLMVERIAMGMTKLRRLQDVEDAMYAKARWETANPIGGLSRRIDSELAAECSMPPIKILDTLARYQTALDRQISKAIGELILLKNKTHIAESIASPLVLDGRTAN